MHDRRQRRRQRGTVRGGDIFRIDLERLEQSKAKQQDTTTGGRQTRRPEFLDHVLLIVLTANNANSLSVSRSAQSLMNGFLVTDKDKSGLCSCDDPTKCKLVTKQDV